MTSMKDRIHKSKEPLGGYLCMIPSAMVSQALAAAGADWLIIDQEHAPIGPENLHAMIAATAGTACAPWVRVPRRDEAYVKPALDAGAEGILFPLVRTAAEAAECVALTTYPPRGRRGWGPFAAHSRWGVELFDYLGKRGGETVCGLLIETKAAVDNIEEICKVEGIDYLVLATFDLSTELGVSGKLDAPILLEAVRHAGQVILKAGIALGAAAFTKEQAQTNMRRGHRLFFYGFDVLMLKQHARQAAGWWADSQVRTGSEERVPAGSSGRGKCPCTLTELLRSQKTLIWCHPGTVLATGMVHLETVLHSPSASAWCAGEK